MKINAFLVPIQEFDEDFPENSISIYIDVLRASSTICAAIHNGAKEIIPVSNLEQAMKIYSSLDRDIRLIGGEKNMKKPANFDLGNSPIEYSPELVSEKTIIFTSTNGTNIFGQASNSQFRIISAFVNFNASLKFLENTISQNKHIQTINIFCAGNNFLFSYEDTLCAGNYISQLARIYPSELNDAALAAKVLFEFHKIDLFDFIKTREHVQKMNLLALNEDVDYCLQYDSIPTVPVVDGISIKKSRI